MMRIFGLLVAAGLVACHEETSDDAGPRDGRDSGSSDGASDGGSVDAQASDAGPSWDEAHCREFECYFIRQSEPGADDRSCNGRSPIDRGTLDADGLRDCPWRSFQNLRLRAAMAPESGPNRKKSFFVGEGRYPVWPFGAQLLGDGAGPEEGLRLGNFRGEHAVLYGDQCPSTCTIETGTGTIALTPCCQIRCPTCAADPRCVPTGDGCGIPWDVAPSVLETGGRWTRIEGLELEGCVSDALIVSSRTSADQRSLLPNDQLFIANNKIHGCQVNENIKGYRQGPSEAEGGPAWGPTQIIGNELLEMASQGIDATGVHRWRVEENYLHDAKREDACLGTLCDGGGIGFKNGGSDARVRNNWLSRNSGIGMGGVSGSCIRDTEPPRPWGCSQRHEMTDALVENNVIRQSRKSGLSAYQCADCRYVGNDVDGVVTSMFWLEDDCPGPRCPAHNPSLERSTGLELRFNRLSGGTAMGQGPFWFAYFRDIFPTGPVDAGMSSGWNVLCAPDGLPESATPETSLLLFGHGEPTMTYAWQDFGVAHLGDVSSKVGNDPAAGVAPCAPRRGCVVNIGGDEVSWTAPALATRCLLVVDEREEEVPCDSQRALTANERGPGRHYAALRVERATGGDSCGASYQVAAPMIGASCALTIDGALARWASSGFSCRLWLDDGRDLGKVPCNGELGLPGDLPAGERHHLRLQVLDSEDGQTACGSIYTP